MNGPAVSGRTDAVLADTTRVNKPENDDSSLLEPVTLTGSAA
jgi:hypothetical protein